MSAMWWHNVLHFSYWNSTSLLVLILFWCFSAITILAILFVFIYLDSKMSFNMTKKVRIILTSIFSGLLISFILIAIIFSMMHSAINVGFLATYDNKEQLWVKENEYVYCINGKDKDKEIKYKDFQWNESKEFYIFGKEIENYYNSEV